jgi:UPF0716 protein FxsA
VGAWLVKRGGHTWQALASALNTGRMPSRQLSDAALVLVGGTLLLTPGFLTDLVGFFCILPITRAIARTVLETIVHQTPRGSSAGRPPPRSPGGSRPGDVIEADHRQLSPLGGCSALFGGQAEPAPSG